MIKRHNYVTNFADDFAHFARSSVQETTLALVAEVNKTGVK